jgi:membrane protease YdiL (CAAX protease family)
VPLTPVTAVTTWLVALAMVFAAGLGLAVAAAMMATSEGLSLDRAVRLLSDPASSPLVKSPTWIAATIVVNELAVAAALFIGLWRVRRSLTEVVYFRRPATSEVVGALLMTFGLSPWAELSAELVHRHISSDATSAQMVEALARGSSGPGFLGALLLAALLPALVEESLFRGFMFRAFERFGAFTAIFVTSLLFAVLHLNPSQAAGSFVLGVAFGLSRWQTLSVVPALLAHALYNAAHICSERIGSGAPHDPSLFHCLVGLLAAAFGWWLLGDRQSRKEAV